MSRADCLLLAVVAVRVGAATVAVVDEAGGGHPEGLPEAQTPSVKNSATQENNDKSFTLSTACNSPFQCAHAMPMQAFSESGENQHAIPSSSAPVRHKASGTRPPANGRRKTQRENRRANPSMRACTPLNFACSRRHCAPSSLQSSCKERPRRTAIHAGIGTYAHVVVAGGLAVEVAGAVLDVAIEHCGLLGARDKGEHCLV